MEGIVPIFSIMVHSASFVDWLNFDLFILFLILSQFLVSHTPRMDKISSIKFCSALLTVVIPQLILLSEAR